MNPFPSGEGLGVCISRRELPKLNDATKLSSFNTAVRFVKNPNPWCRTVTGLGNNHQPSLAYGILTFFS